MCVLQVCPMGICMTVKVSMSNESTEAMNERGDAKMTAQITRMLFHREVWEHAFARLPRSRASATGTAKAVAWLRSNYEKPLRVEHLATIAGMSRSTLHLHFRALTAVSPLQFQKQLRLHAARQRILTRELDAAANSIASTGDSLAGPQFAMSRPCETEKSWRLLPLNAELLGSHGQLVLDCRKQALGPQPSLSQ